MKTGPAGEWTIDFDPHGKAVRVSLMRDGRAPFIVEMKAIEAQRYALEQIRRAKASERSFSFWLDSAEVTAPIDQALVFFNQLIETARKARDGIN